MSVSHFRSSRAMKRIILLSGPIGAGKTTLAENLSRKYAARVVKTRELIAAILATARVDREHLQGEGEALDARTGGAWLTEQLMNFDVQDAAGPIIVDSVRTLEQIESIRDSFGRTVTHIHLTAPRSSLEERYERREHKELEFRTYSDAARNATESRVESLADYCDVLIDTSLSTHDDVLVRAAARIGLYQMVAGACVDVVIGGEYGSEGKGNIASYLAPEYQYLVRVGGPNAGHKVITPNYTYRSLPSGTQHAPRAKLIIGPGATIQIETLMKEIKECGVDPARLSIDPQSMVIEESDIDAEKGLKASIGSTGQGGGFAAARRMLRNRLSSVPVRLARDVEELKPYVLPSVDALEKAYAEGAHIMLEGTQGTGLSLFHGHYPHVTSRDTTVSGTLAEAGIPPARVRRVVMVCRSYPIRVGDPPQGTSGYMAQPLSWEIIAKRSGIPLGMLTAAEVGSVSGSPRRVGEFEWSLFRKACSLNAPTDIALTFADYVAAANEGARRFEQLDDKTIRFIEELERVGSAPVSLISTRFHARSIIDRRMW